jgi:hypothetical protein
MPSLPVAEQGGSQRLFRLSHGRASAEGHWRYKESVLACGRSLRPRHRARKGLQPPQVGKPVGQRPGATPFPVRLSGELARNPTFLPRQFRMMVPSPSRLTLATPDVGRLYPRRSGAVRALEAQAESRFLG